MGDVMFVDECGMLQRFDYHPNNLRDDNCTSMHCRNADNKRNRQQGTKLAIRFEDHSSITMKATSSSGNLKRSTTAGHIPVSGNKARSRGYIRMVWFIGSYRIAGWHSVQTILYSRLPAWTAFATTRLESDIRDPRNKLSG